MGEARRRKLGDEQMTSTARVWRFLKRYGIWIVMAILVAIVVILLAAGTEITPCDACGA